MLYDALHELPVDRVTKTSFKVLHYGWSKVVVVQGLLGETKQMAGSDLESSVEVPVGAVVVSLNHVSKGVKSFGFEELYNLSILLETGITIKPTMYEVKNY